MLGCSNRQLSDRYAPPLLQGLNQVRGLPFRVSRRKPLSFSKLEDWIGIPLLGRGWDVARTATGVVGVAALRDLTRLGGTFLTQLFPQVRITEVRCAEKHSLNPNLHLVSR